MSIKTLGIVIPAYNEAKTLAQNMQKLAETLSAAKIEHRIVLVDDGSSDATWEEILRLTRTDAHFLGVRFARNFGKEVALCAHTAKNAAVTRENLAAIERYTGGTLHQKKLPQPDYTWVMPYHNPYYKPYYLSFYHLPANTDLQWH